MYLLAILKFLRHYNALISLNVMSLMSGEFVNDHAVKFTDVFVMPQSGTETSI